MTQDPDQHGLDLFDETASAVRGFPNAMLGYEKKAVDEYIRDVERQLALAKHQLREVQRELTAASLRVDDTDFSRLGAHTASLLRVAEAQGADLISKAEQRAEAMIAEARAEAEQIRAQTARTAEDARQEGIASIKGLRADLERQTAIELQAARAEAQGLRDAADAHRAEVIENADREAAVLLASATAEAHQVRQAAERVDAEARAMIAKERDEALSQLAAERRTLLEQLHTASEQARARADELQVQLVKASEDLRGRQQAAYAEAEDIKAAALSEAGSIVSAAKIEAEDLLRQADRDLDQKNEQLRRDNRTLRHRKQALLTQLNQLSSLATVTASEFPEDEHTGPITAAMIDEPVAGAGGGPEHDEPAPAASHEVVTDDVVADATDVDRFANAGPERGDRDAQ